jgi:hypothetical protein
VKVKAEKSQTVVLSIIPNYNQRLKKPKGSISEATGGEAVWPILRTSGNPGYGALTNLPSMLRVEKA